MRLGQIREVKVEDIITHALIPPFIIAGIWVITPLFLVDHIPVRPEFIYIGAALLTYYPLKWLAIGTVLLYKAFAPMSVRKRCRFTPTCSTYMIMAIYKYGLFIGALKGINRIFRCKPPNGGEDYP
jgi:putative membrane protein insertion efficiency factor